jgi:SET domain-containing protein
MGRGIFAGRLFRKGEIIEICPVVPVGRRFEKKCNGEVLEHYLFQWGPRNSAVVLGYGSIYNHSDKPNASFRPRMARLEMVYRAMRDIQVGEQILVDYEWPDFERELKEALPFPAH